MTAITIIITDTNITVSLDGQRVAEFEGPAKNPIEQIAETVLRRANPRRLAKIYIQATAELLQATEQRN